MKLKEIIRGTKLVLDDGKWQQGHIPRYVFPLSTAKPKNYKFGQDYKWRVIRFECVSVICRVLILYNENKNIYRATLGVEDGGDMRVLCHYEFHASEPGWHCHFTVKDHDAVLKGTNRTGMRRWPAARIRHKHMAFGVELRSALTKAAERYQIRAQGQLL